MRIAIIGTGYVGLVSGACFSDFGHHVTCVDKDEKKIAALRDGVMPIFEPGLDLVVERNVRDGRLDFTTDIEPAVRDAQVVFIAVGTPSRRGDGFADLTYVFDATREIATFMNKFTVIVTKSTVPVGTGDAVESLVREVRPDADFAVASNPEFLREGAAIDDFKRPDRIVIGVEDDRARDIMKELYRPLFLNETPMLFTRRRTSELIKYAANGFLAMKITFINEMADLCEAVGADVQEVARGIGFDGRIGTKFLHAGPGYGGSCFPKDTLALTRTAQSVGAPLRLIETVVDINDKRKKAMSERIAAAVDGKLEGKTVAILGLTFKPNTDDMRDSPSLTIVPDLIAAGAKVQAFDPEGMTEARHSFPGATFAKDPYEAAEGADVIAILTEWDQFRALDLEKIRNLLKKPVMVDLRNIYKPADMVSRGFVYTSIGRPHESVRPPLVRGPSDAA